MIYMRNITITTAKSATYLENVGSWVCDRRSRRGHPVRGVGACAAAGRSASRDPQADANLLWTALHGVVTLRVAAPDFPWPDLGTQLPQLVERLALLGPGSG